MSHPDQDVTSPAELFDLLWENLADVLGTAATATLMRVLLVELTGPVVVGRLARLAPLRERGIDFGGEKPK